MKVATLTEAKNRLGALIDHVRAGETVLILDRGIPVARLESVVPLDEDPEGRVARLQRAGTVRAARESAPVALASEQPPRPRKGASAVQALLDERRAGR